MKTYILPQISIALLLLAATITSCQQEKPTNAKLSFNSSLDSAQQIKIGIVNTFDFSDSTLAEITLDSVGHASVELAVTDSILAYINVKEKGFQLYLVSGYDLTINISETEEELNVSFSGKGAEVNNYLVQAAKLKEELQFGYGEEIMRLDKNKFMQRLDTIRVVLENHLQGYSNSVMFSDELIGTLEQKIRLELISIKSTYALVHFWETPDISARLEKVALEKGKEGYFQIPLDTALLNNSLLGLEYTLLMNYYSDLLAFPIYIDLAKTEEQSSINKIFPFVAEKTIKKKEYPSGVEELLLAKNVLNFMEGALTPSTDSLFNNFKKQYPQSEYIEPLQTLHDDWYALAPGQPAPPISGTTPDGKEISLSDFKGKVVYVDVWSTTCPPCIEEFPHAKKLMEEFKEIDQVTFLFVSVDGKKRIEKWKEMVAEKQLGGIQINNPEAPFWKDYMMSGVPQYVLIDQEGKLVNVNPPRPSSGEVKEEILKLLTPESDLASRL
ncbi:TlpA disulfide reductase family protein [Flammeovirgaceae bacterium SG7u.111]|nr:TlpA disulfide reductase family protein [Flammeovirgaceae bacterium SG7u.132]WPO34348.1 TlpA disulfide reductase family protein [Flammeovirgaceae bacterium SG7u.111]